MDNSQDPWGTPQEEKKEERQVQKFKESTERSEPKTSKLAVLSLILSIIIPPLGLALSVISLHLIKGSPNLKGRNLAITGLIIGIAISVIGIAFIIIFIVILKKFSVSFL